MNIVDIGIVIFLAFGALLGFKRGFIHGLVKAVGFLLVIILAYFLKNPLSIFLYEHLPFFNFGFLKGAAILNILLYEIIAFLIVVAILMLLLRLLLVVTKIFEQALNATIILGIPSKLAGALVGFIHDYIIVFLILYIITLVGINVSIIDESKLKEQIVNNTPILSDLVNKNIVVIDEFKTIKKNYSDKSISTNEFNYKTMELFLHYKIISPTSARKLIENKKLDSFEEFESLLKNYKEA